MNATDAALFVVLWFAILYTLVIIVVSLTVVIPLAVSSRRMHKDFSGINRYTHKKDHAAAMKWFGSRVFKYGVIVTIVETILLAFRLI